MVLCTYNLKQLMLNIGTDDEDAHALTRCLIGPMWIGTFYNISCKWDLKSPIEALIAVFCSGKLSR